MLSLRPVQASVALRSPAITKLLLMLLLRSCTILLIRIQNYLLVRPVQIVVFRLLQVGTDYVLPRESRCDISWLAAHGGSIESSLAVLFERAEIRQTVQVVALALESRNLLHLLGVGRTAGRTSIDVDESVSTEDSRRVVRAKLVSIHHLVSNLVWIPHEL